MYSIHIQKLIKMFLYLGRSDEYFSIDGGFPNGTIPGLEGNIFVKLEGVGDIIFLMQKL